MLISFSVANFLSFKSRATLSMAATMINRHPNHIIPLENEKVLKGAFIFGANASGKSNFVKALSFARGIILYGLDRINLDSKYFKIDPAFVSKPGEFEF